MARQIESRVPNKLIERLEDKRTKLKQEVKRIDSQMHLRPEEEMALQRLKKEKLRAKDTIKEVRESIAP